jgi:phage shock protein E
MDWVIGSVVVGGAVALWLVKRAGQIGPAAAQEFLKAGALVIDVRNPGEFGSGHLPGAINVPLGDLAQGITRHAPDKHQVLLLHCVSGVRSGMGRRVLKRLGYAQVFNLGSYGRAARIVQASRG